MRRAIPILGAALLSLAILIWGAAAGQALGPDSECDASCEQERMLCVERCGAHDDPVECEGECDARAQDCSDSCRD